MAFDLDKALSDLQKSDFGYRKWNNKPYQYFRTQITHSLKGYKINIHSDGYLGSKATGKTIEEAWKKAIDELKTTIKEMESIKG